MNDSLADRVKALLAQGASKEQIYADLIGQGLKIEDINDAFQLTERGERRKDTQQTTIRVVVTIAVLFVGAGVFSLIASNWQEMAKAVKISLIVLGMLVSYGGGWRLKEKLNFPKSGDAMILLGSIIYGAGIFLVAQMFHTRAEWPDGFILWMIGTLVMAFATEVFFLFYLALITGAAAFIGYPIIIFVGSTPFLLTPSILLVIATAVTFAAGWMIRRRALPSLKDFY